MKEWNELIVSQFILKIETISGRGTYLCFFCFVGTDGSLTQENLATRGKMEQLRMIMEERRARRRARREARAAPYWGAGPSSAGGEGSFPSTPAASPQRACAATASIAASASPDDPMEAADELLAPEAVLA